MQTGLRSPVTPDRLAILAVIGISALFLVTRLPLLFLRDAFFDELFTVWISGKSFPEILEALRYDSGPPLYYFFVRTLRIPAGDLTPGLTLARCIALLCGAASLFLVFSARAIGKGRWLAAAFLSVYFPAVYFSVEARSYALCGLMVGAGSLFLMRWIESENRRTLLGVVVCFVLAAASHFYGVLFFALPAVFGVFLKRRSAVVSGLLASILCGVLFLPGFLLALGQPRDAIGWMQADGELVDPGDVLFPQRLGPVAPFPPIFAAAAPIALELISLLVVLMFLVRPTLRSNRGWIFATITVVPWLLALLLALMGRPSYFPMRFESVVAVPLALWWGESLQTMPRRVAMLITAVLIVMGLYVANASVLLHSARGPDDFRRAALAARAAIPGNAVVVATGYSFLETTVQRGPGWTPQIRSFPQDQAFHPGWRSEVPLDRVSAEIEAVLKDATQFFWISDNASQELEALSRNAVLTPIYRSGPVFVMRGIRKPGGEESGGTSAPDPE